MSSRIRLSGEYIIHDREYVIIICTIIELAYRKCEKEAVAFLTHNALVNMVCNHIVSELLDNKFTSFSPLLEWAEMTGITPQAFLKQRIDTDLLVH